MSSFVVEVGPTGAQIIQAPVTFANIGDNTLVAAVSMKECIIAIRDKEIQNLQQKIVDLTPKQKPELKLVPSETGEGVVIPDGSPVS